MNKNIPNILSLGDEVKIPQWWSGKRIPGGRFGETMVSLSNKPIDALADQDGLKSARSQVGSLTSGGAGKKSPLIKPEEKFTRT